MVYDPEQWRDRAETPGWSPDGNGHAFKGGSSYGENAYDRDIDRDRAIGAAAQGTQAVTVNQDPANQTRGFQLNALDMLRRQASGEAPSSAAILSQRANQDAVRAAGMQVAGARTAGGGIAALRGAGEQAGSAMLAGNAHNADARAGEISRGQGAFAGGAGTINKQDIGVATTDAQLAAQQRALDEQRQQFFERQAFDTRGVQRQAESDSIAQLHRKLEADRAYKAAKTAADIAGVKDTISLATGGISGAAGSGVDTSGSDPRMKMHIGSLTALMRGRR